MWRYDGPRLLFDYVVRELGYTAAAAWRRIKAMRLSIQIGVAGELLRDGSLNVSNAAQLQNLFERSDRNHGRQHGDSGTGVGRGGTPQNNGTARGRVPATPMGAGERGPGPVGGPVLDAAAREKLVKQAVGKSTREVQQMLAEVDPALAQPNDRLRALGGGSWELKAAVDAECRHGLEKLQMVLSHTEPHLTLGRLVARLVREGLDRHDPERPRRSRRSRGRGSTNGAHTVDTPVPGGTGAKPQSVASAKGGEQDDASPAAVRAVASRHPAPKRHAGVEQGSAKSAAVRETIGRTDSAPKRPSDNKQGSASPAAVPNRSGHTASPAKRSRRGESGRPLQAALRQGGRCAASAPKRVGQDEDAQVEQAERLCGTTEAASGRRRVAERSCVQPQATHGNGGPACSLPIRQRSTARDGCGELLYAAGHGALGPAERSPALQRHLAAFELLRRVAGLSVPVRPRCREARGVAPRPGLLQLYRPAQWPALQLPLSAGDRPHRPIRARRRYRAREPQNSVPGTSPVPSRPTPSPTPRECAD
jgi:hypothetical protein